MTHEAIFSAASVLSMLGWVFLLTSPYIPDWADRIAGFWIPALLAATYVGVLVFMPGAGGGFESFDAVATLFASPGPVLAGWIHFLAFDLVVGAWACRTARTEGIAFRWVLPCLPAIFLLGPLGFLLFLGVRSLHHFFWPSER